MNYSLAERHLKLANHTYHAANHHVEVQMDSIVRIWDGETYSRPEHLDEYSAFSGDDLARINAFEPADPKLKPIGNQTGLWSAVKEGAHHVRSAA